MNYQVLGAVVVLLDLPARRKNSISLTPLIDVVFILLLFFMLSSTFNQAKQIELSSAMTGKAKQVTSSTTTQKILLYSENDVEVNGVRYEWRSQQMLDQLASFAANGDNVVLAARSHVSVQSVIKLIDQVSVSGVKNLNISESVTR